MSRNRRISAASAAWRGAVAGAAGTVALNLVTYLDMAVRGRPGSTLPGNVARRFAERAGVNLGEAADNRGSGVGGFVGQVNGVAVGAGYGVARRFGARLPWPVATVAVAAGVMAAGNVPAAASGATDPRSWSGSEWASDVVPHLVYGAVTAAVVDSLD